MLFHFSFYSIISLSFLLLYFYRDDQAAETGIRLYTLIAVIWLGTTLSFREPTGDPSRYMLGLERISAFNFSQVLAYEGPIGFNLLNWAVSLLSVESEFFFSVIYILCIIPLYLAFREKYDKTHASTLLMLYLLYPFYLTYLGNGFKQGIAFGFMLWGYNCLISSERSKLIKGLSLLVIATLFHNSFWIAILAFAAWRFWFRNRSIVWVLAILILCMILSLLNLVEPIIRLILPANIIDSLSFNEYFSDSLAKEGHYRSLNYKTGFRLDFALFTALPIIGALLLNPSKLNTNYDNDLLKIYCLLASAYFLLSFIPFSDRVAAFSWFLIPYILYELTNKKKYQTVFVAIMLISYGLLMLIYTKGYFQ